MKFGALIFAFLVLMPVSLAQETSPLWFRLLEPVGAAIAFIAIVYLYRNIKIFGGRLGKSYRYIIGALILFMLAFVWRSIVENGFLPDDMFAETTFEMLLYLGIILIAVASRIARDGVGPLLERK